MHWQCLYTFPGNYNYQTGLGLVLTQILTSLSSLLGGRSVIWPHSLFFSPLLVLVLVLLHLCLDIVTLLSISTSIWQPSSLRMVGFDTGPQLWPWPWLFPLVAVLLWHAGQFFACHLGLAAMSASYHESLPVLLEIKYQTITYQYFVLTRADIVGLGVHRFDML